MQVLGEVGVVADVCVREKEKEKRIRWSVAGGNGFGRIHVRNRRKAVARLLEKKILICKSLGS